jgi:tyrosyl-tRNA synthetase
MLPVDEQMRLLMRGVEYGDEQIRAAMDQELRERLGEGRPLRVYLGVDPSAPDLTLGHTVPMYKLRQFQDLGHDTIFLIGNFTGLVGDPSDKDTRRPILTPEELEANARTYTEQAFKVLDPERTIIDYNANWLGKLTFADLIQVASNFTVGQFLQRENFALRRERGDPIYLHEFFYALMQGYDAVALRCDVQVGGTDQLFNIMAGRTLQRAYGQRPQVPVCVPILVGTDGRLRMSKTQGNHIALTDLPDDTYGKVMSLPDHLIVDYFTLVTRVPAEEVEEVSRQLQERSVNPMELKKRLAREIVGQYHGKEAADAAEDQFTRLIQKRVSDQAGMAEEATIGLEVPISSLESYGNDLMALLLDRGLVQSKGEARRLMKQGAIDVDGRPITDFDIPFQTGMVVRVGKHRFLRIVDADKQ